LGPFGHKPEVLSEMLAGTGRRGGRGLRVVVGRDRQDFTGWECLLTGTAGGRGQGSAVVVGTDRRVSGWWCWEPAGTTRARVE
jgi:hypothetical protein